MGKGDRLVFRPVIFLTAVCLREPGCPQKRFIFRRGERVCVGFPSDLFASLDDAPWSL